MTPTTTLLTYAQWIEALTLYREASGVSHAARVGIHHNILNRVKVGGWWAKPNEDVVSVVTHRGQYSGMTTIGNPDTVRWAQDSDPVWEDCAAIVMDGSSEDPTEGSTYYWTYPLTAAPTQEWGPTVETAVIDGVHFCKAT